MSIKFEKIEKSEFKNKQNGIVLLDNTSDDNFGRIQWNECVFQIGWRGDFILPVIKEINSIMFGLGIDFNFFIINCSKNKIIYKLELDEYFINFTINNNKIYIASELKVTELTIDNLKISNEFYLPEIFDDFIIVDNSIRALCIDKQTIMLDTY